MKYLILSKIIIFPSTLFFVTYLYYFAIKKKKNYFGSQKYILKSKIPLTVTASVIFVSLSLWRATQEQWREESVLLSVEWDRITVPSESEKNHEQMPWSLWTNFDFESVYF